MRQKNKTPLRLAKSTCAIVGDGDCEAWYIQMLKRNEPLTHVDLKPEFPQKKALSELYEQVIELSNDYDEVYWLVDMDVILKETKEAKAGEKTRLQEFEEYCEKIEKINEEYKKKYAVDNDLIKIIINNPGFEYWLLLHFKNTTKYYTSCDEVIKEFKSYQEISDYKKSRKYYTKQDNDIYKRLKPYLKDAVTNSKKTGEFDFSNPERGLSQMHLLFESDNLKHLIE